VSSRGQARELGDPERFPARARIEAGHPSSRSASGAEPAQPDSAARSVLRRCRNAASTTANTSSRVAVVCGGSRLVNATRRESTFGTGQNTLRGTGPAGRAAANQASLTTARRTPVIRAARTSGPPPRPGP
jgi:hypothetical protein